MKALNIFFVVLGIILLNYGQLLPTSYIVNPLSFGVLDG
jgi:hypothetical protein